MEKTFIMVKPDGVERQLVGEILSRFERKGLQLAGAKLMAVSEQMAENHYAEHKGKPFFGELVEFITSGPVFAMVWEGENVIEVTRQLIGKTNPQEALPGTIRGDFGMFVGKNIIHGSDSLESAEREINIFFKQEELVPYQKLMTNWIY
ncbi:nucleoside-diphosphate kinase [Bacillus atrophaeus]|jgi:nucleoside-diphosphate kinase|uniref:Nucleoside diphosphate kinase n=1 Tax=Bacillus atrophaeus (strain 1942) TaxID=720555 RepID=A0ABM5LXW5_BACA1|nr:MULTISPECIES: nucleoside-diphosphate kinase [Bacillus]AMR62419.1 nucleoside-diphosphate kinase [Bacillus subtilis subsp. globigii]MBT2626744.1 nucleoside-diphosphate kinase [Bacillus sp. ISL-32]ADP32780.1 nucleoside diphosphate kinase [Bacillus atrophaeus 1942]AIK48126.1 nucleoside diphosphate kinase [Bacillus atrophaeus subsp. globigii]AKL84944.1 Ndk [Bacillus atrophaeus UCMB-5137]